MEASEKPQLALEDATVRLLADRLVIERLEIADARAARVVRERAEGGQLPAETVTKAIEIGARVLDREEVAAEVDYVRAEFERHSGELRERLTKTLEAGDRQLAERIAASFDGGRDGSVPKAIEDRVKQALSEQREALLNLFSAEEGANPLFDFKDAMVRVYRELGTRQQSEGEENRKRIDELTRQIIELKERDEANRRVAEAEDAGTRKGFTFEERVHAAIERIARLRGDCASHTGGEAAEGGGKKGDVLVELGAAEGPALGRVLFEAKDKKLSQNDAWRELNDGMSGRAAAFGVLVVAGDERVPARTQALTEYQGNKIVVAVDRDEPDGIALEVAYRLAAARVAMARDRELAVDAVAVRDTAQEALALLRQAQAIRTTLSHIKTSSDKARGGLDELVESVRAKLERIDALVAEAE
jgi:polyhydroxyalkanoate synthesis regulator phasin